MSGRLLGYLRESDRPGWQLPPHVDAIHDFDAVRLQLAVTADTSPGDTGLFALPDRSPDFVQDSQDCVANATIGACMAIMPDPLVLLARRDLYWKARRLSGDEGVDRGTYVRNAFAAWGVGVCREADWPYDKPVNEQPSLIAEERGYDLRGKVKFHEILTIGPQRCDDIELALRAGMTIVFGVDVGEAFLEFFRSRSSSRNEVLWHQPGSVVGGHAMFLRALNRFGADGRAFLAKNSWGPGGSADHPGHAWLSDDYMYTAEDVFAVESVAAFP